MGTKSIKFNMMISEGEKKMIDDLCKRFSCNTSEMIRGWLRDNHRRVFPAYMNKIIKPIPMKPEEMTVEQKCEFIGGTIIKDNSGVVIACRKPLEAPGSYSTIDINKIDNFIKKS